MFISLINYRATLSSLELHFKQDPVNANSSVSFDQYDCFFDQVIILAVFVWIMYRRFDRSTSPKSDEAHGIYDGAYEIAFSFYAHINGHLLKSLSPCIHLLTYFITHFIYIPLIFSLLFFAAFFFVNPGQTDEFLPGWEHIYAYIPRFSWLKLIFICWNQFLWLVHTTKIHNIIRA